MQQSISCRSLHDRAGFRLDGHRHTGKGREFFPELLPAASRVLETEISDDFAAAIQDDDVVMILGPVESRVMSDLIPCFHSFVF